MNGLQKVKVILMADTYDATKHIFGLTWLDEYAEAEASTPTGMQAQAFLNEWAEKIEELSSAGLKQELIEMEFFEALYAEEWYDLQNNAWYALQEMRYGGDPKGEWVKLQDTTRAFIEEALKSLGFVDDLTGELLIEVSDSFVEDVIFESADVPIVGGAVQLNENTAAKFIENNYLPKRSFVEEDGAFDIGAGSLQTLYNELEGLARSNFVQVNEEDLWDIAISLKREDITLDYAYDIITSRMADQFSFLEDTPILRRIMGSELTYNTDGTLNRQAMSSLQSHLSPYQQRIASLWGVPYNSISMTDLFGESLDDFVVGEPGEEHFMKMRDVRDWARSHPNYKQSEDYGTKMGEIARSMVGVFGG